MMRKQIKNARKDQSYFSRTAKSMHIKNKPRVNSRGGIRL
jgi:hypothetical protein